MPFAFNGVRGSKQKFANYVLAQTTAVDHDLQALIAQYRLAHDSSATQCAPLDDIEVHTPDESILAEPIVSSVESEYARFVSKLGAADWVRHGHTHYSQAAGTTCPFCQQTLPTDFEQTLKACFDSEYDRKVQALETFSRAYKQATALLERMPLSRDLGPMPEQADLSTYDALVTALKDRISSNLNRIDNKLNAPSTTVVLQPLGELTGLEKPNGLRQLPGWIVWFEVMPKLWALTIGSVKKQLAMWLLTFTGHEVPSDRIFRRCAMNSTAP